MRIIHGGIFANKHGYWLSPIPNGSMGIDGDLGILSKIYDICMLVFTPKSPRPQKAMGIDGDCDKYLFLKDI